MRKEVLVDISELETRIQKNFDRLSEPYYQIENVFQEPNADWPGDKEGRALLAFVRHFEMSARKIPCMEPMLAQLPQKTNKDGFFGPRFEGVADEQQLSGHSWMLRGLCEAARQFPDSPAREFIRSIVENLYLPTKGKYRTYPVERAGAEGGVSGNSTGVVDGWRLSSDVGCAFMSIDGLSDAFALTGDERIKELLDEMIGVFCGIDKVKIRAQTHCSLTAARGMIRVYRITGENAYLDKAREIFDLYTSEGMTLTYQNLNWWGRPDTWTEPCAIVDSLMAAIELFEETGEGDYRVLAARIYHNGFASLQRDNGGAGTDSVVAPGGEDSLFIKMPEAYFCCTMRLAEGLWAVKKSLALLSAFVDEGPEIDGAGRYMDGDILYAEAEGADITPFINPETVVVKDGHVLTPLLKFYDIPLETAMKIRQRVVFR